MAGFLESIPRCLLALWNGFIRCLVATYGFLCRTDIQRNPPKNRLDNPEGRHELRGRRGHGNVIHLPAPPYQSEAPNEAGPPEETGSFMSHNEYLPGPPRDEASASKSPAANSNAAKVQVTEREIERPSSADSQKTLTQDTLNNKSDPTALKTMDPDGVSKWYKAAREAHEKWMLAQDIGAKEHEESLVAQRMAAKADSKEISAQDLARKSIPTVNVHPATPLPEEEKQDPMARNDGRWSPHVHFPKGVNEPKSPPKMNLATNMAGGPGAVLASIFGAQPLMENDGSKSPKENGGGESSKDANGGKSSKRNDGGESSKENDGGESSKENDGDKLLKDMDEDEEELGMSVRK